MSESVLEIRDRLRSRRPRVTRASVAPAASSDVSLTAGEVPPTLDAGTIVMENDERVTVSTPLREVAGRTPFTTRLSGRLVEAERANRNGAFWTQGDLEFGLPTVAYGPLNWLHDEKKVIGTLLDPHLVDAEHAAATDLKPHIRTDAVVWDWIHREEARAVKHYAEAGRAWLSMECIAASVECTGPNGCGKEVAWGQTKGPDSCDHLRERSSFRRMKDPVFQGAAVIVPPTSPGWADADLELAAERVLEAASLTPAGMSDAEAAGLLQQIIAWSQR